jgi:hypothetical protein
MQLKPITAIIVLFLVVASLSFAGCVQTEVTLSPANQASDVSTAYPTAGKSELLQGMAAHYDESAAHYEDYKVTWINNTALTIHEKSSSVDSVYTYDYKFIHFPTIDAATAYFDSHRLEYNHKPSYIDHASLYSLVTGAQNASVVKEVTRYGTPTDYHLEQFNSLIIETSSRADHINQA